MAEEKRRTTQVTVKPLPTINREIIINQGLAKDFVSLRGNMEVRPRANGFGEIM